MIATTQLHTAFNLITQIYNTKANLLEVVTKTGSNLIEISFAQPEVLPLPGMLSVEDLIAQMEALPEGKENLSKGRQWVADSYYDEQKPTIRSMRLQLGLSQKDLSMAMQTTQPQIAKVESCKNNMMRSTMRDLCAVLSTSMDQLDTAIANQEEINARPKQ